jgi:predicted nucleic-acid-binding protein
VGIGDVSIHLDALDRYAKTNVHFVECLIAATGRGGKDAGSLMRSRLSKVH